jgi:hypothetical protein
LKFSAAGSQGLTELKESIAKSEQSVFFAFCRICVDGTDCFATITYIPQGTSGLRRGAQLPHHHPSAPLTAEQHGHP